MDSGRGEISEWHPLDRLKAERERRKISLDEISASTKISTRLLHALEEDHFELLPGGIFNKGFVRAYAQHLGLDEEQMIVEYLEASGVVPDEEKSDGGVAAPVAEIRAEAGADDGASLPWGLFAIVLLIVALAFAVWGFYARETTNGGKMSSVRSTYLVRAANSVEYSCREQLQLGCFEHRAGASGCYARFNRFHPRFGQSHQWKFRQRASGRRVPGAHQRAERFLGFRYRRWETSPAGYSDRIGRKVSAGGKRDHCESRRHLSP